MPQRPQHDDAGAGSRVSHEDGDAPQALGDREPRRRSGFSWRHLLIIGIICVLLGAAIPIALNSAQQSAATARTEAMRDAAGSYLSAIADGEWEEATSLVPTTGPATVAPAALLDAAERIQNPEIVLARADGDSGVVEVRYDVPSRPTALTVSRLLEAQHVDGAWQLTTSLAELPSVANYEGVIVPAVAGTALSRPSALLLYPGTYPLDPPVSPIYELDDETFVIDGDPGTLTEITAFPEWSEAMLGEAESRAVQHAEACRAAGACEWSQAATISGAGAVVFAPATASEVQLEAMIEVFNGVDNEMQPVSVWLSLDGDGEVEGARCQGLAGFSDEPVDCTA